MVGNRFVLSQLDLPMGQWKVFTSGNGDRVLCVFDSKQPPNQYYGWYVAKQVLTIGD